MDPAKDGEYEFTTVEVDFGHPGLEALHPKEVTSFERLVPKLHLVQKIADHYESHPARVFTSTQHAFFFYLSIEVLEEIQDDKQTILNLGDYANYFVKTTNSGQGTVPKNAVQDPNLPIFSAGGVKRAAFDPGLGSEAGPSKADPPVDQRSRSMADNLSSSLRTIGDTIIKRTSVTKGKEKRRASISALTFIEPSPKRSKGMGNKLESEEKQKQEPLKRNEAAKAAVLERDHGICIVTRNMGASEKSHIAAFQINASTGKLTSLHESFTVPMKLFGPTFTNELRALLCSLGVSDEFWNILTFHASFHRKFDKCLVGLRPIRITKTTRSNDPDGKHTKFHVVFAVHWLAKTRISRRVQIRPSEERILEMIGAAANYRDNHIQYQDIDIIDGHRIVDGTEISVLAATQDSPPEAALRSARKMFTMLHLRWATTLIQHMEGASGIHGDDERDEDDWQDYQLRLLQEDDELTEELHDRRT